MSEVKVYPPDLNLGPDHISLPKLKLRNESTAQHVPSVEVQNADLTDRGALTCRMIVTAQSNVTTLVQKSALLIIALIKKSSLQSTKRRNRLRRVSEKNSLRVHTQ
jgi:hypothetical protein